MAKRKLEAKILEEYSGDELWDKALDAQDLASRSAEATRCRAYYKQALKYAQASQRVYRSDAESGANDPQTFLEYAEQVATDLITPFENKIAELDLRIATEREARAQQMQLDTSSSSAATPAIVTPSPTSVPGTMFSSVSPASHSIYNLFSIKGFANIHEIKCLTGTGFERYNQLINRLQNVLSNKLRRDILDSSTMVEYAEDLLTFSYDCKDILMGWLEQETSDPRCNELKESALILSQKSAITAKLYYKELRNRALEVEASRIIELTDRMLENTRETLETSEAGPNVTF